MAFGFVKNILHNVEHGASTVARGNSNPGGGIFGFLGNAVRIAYPQSKQSTNKSSHPISLAPNPNNFPIALNQAQGIARTIPEAAETIIHPLRQSTYTPGSSIEQAAFGKTPVQNIQEKVAKNYDAHSNLNPLLRVGLAGAEGAASVAQDTPVFGFLGKVARAGTEAAAPIVKAGANQLAHANEIGAISKDVSKTAKPEDIHIPTNAGNIRISPDELMSLSKAKSPSDVKSIIGDALPQTVIDRIAPGIALAKDPNIISNIISKGVNDSLPKAPAPVPQVLPPGHVPTNSLRLGSDALGEVDPQQLQNAISDIKSGKPMEPLIVSHEPDGTFVQDGKHRLLAAKETGLPSVPVQTREEYLNGQSPASKQITDALGEAQKTRQLQEQGYTKERAARIGAAQGAGEELEGSQGYRAELAQLKGPLAKEEYQGLSGHLSPTEQENLFSELRQQIKDNPNINGYADINTQAALRKVIFGEGGVPTNSEIKLLQNLDPKLAETVAEDVSAHTEKLNTIKSFGSKAAEVAGVPRAIMASVDFSGGLRQGLAAATRHPALFAKEWVKQFKSFASEDAYRESLDAIENHPNFQLMKVAKLAIQDVGSHRPSEHEEQFVSSLAEKIPGLGKLVHASNRAYTGLLSNLRANVFNQLVETSRHAGVDFEDPANLKLLKDFATVVNTSTGRGNLGRLEPAGHALSTALFAPRLIASRLSVLDPRYYVNLEAPARREALTTLASLGAVATTVLGLAAAAGAKVNLDPTNADFGKIKIGDTRLDILGGYQQYLRLGAQLVEGKKTDSITGATTELGKDIAASRWDVLTNFITNKAAPVPSLAIEVLKGKDAAGNPINYPKEVLSRFTPLIAQDIRDLYTHPNSAGPLAAVGGLFGVGLQTYSAQDNPLSTKQKSYIDNLKQNNASPDTIKASTSFFQDLKEAAGTRTNVNTAVDKAIAANDLPKAQQLADQYNKELAGGMNKWAQQYGETYGNSDLQTAYNRQKINLTPSSVNQRIKALQSTKPY